MAARSAASSSVAQRYAAALFELAREREALDAVARDLDRLEAMLAESPDLRRTLDNPLLARDELERTVTGLAERVGLDPLVRNALGVLAQHRRLGLLPQTIAQFRERLAELRGEATAEIVSAAPLPEEDLERLREAIARFAGKKVRLATRVDPELLAGLTVRIGSKMVDASLRRRLRQLEMVMKGVG
ncbi:MAG: F0F1 ATP synthase subunit delta [Geminicoccaceae bacterium]|nr:F0F1 ATP synthase subunit delta [Geminicoccaceae bacterium]MCS7267668.1 F0F1 ATP synthase subunit delta [Geminicoccaceae bacterium]MCX7628710.1 F0F1 ATP synthase subunit delta [Geminicoccaceae bacterium]MDW8123511.1 F0F1 ATP synthase subunit delta [Geminicoccaceae bacterium]MDW8339852.1 F0F1 ATP synthase subunit delta [Geminicoccaceae bacterium]